MTISWLERLDRLPVWAVVALGLSVIPLLGVVDHLTGEELTFFIFYFPVIILVSWRSTRAGQALAIFSAICWAIANLSSGRYRWDSIIPYWNFSVRLLCFLFVASLISRIRQAIMNEKLLARTDNLTGLANSRAFLELAELEITRCSRTGSPITMGFMDCDDFKRVNDEMGHDHGNRLLHVTASILQNCLRRTDVVARFGGDEFVMLLPTADGMVARAIFEKVRLRLDQQMKLQGWPVTFSIGVVTFALPPPSASAMIRCADDLMYQVKRETKDGIRFLEVFDANLPLPGQVEIPATLNVNWRLHDGETIRSIAR
ncbi:MAG: GGDEF domain-containing protein [Planctomycetota bacterium]